MNINNTKNYFPSSLLSKPHSTKINAPIIFMAFLGTKYHFAASHRVRWKGDGFFRFFFFFLSLFFSFPFFFFLLLFNNTPFYFLLSFPSFLFLHHSLLPSSSSPLFLHHPHLPSQRTNDWTGFGSPFVFFQTTIVPIIFFARRTTLFPFFFSIDCPLISQE